MAQEDGTKEERHTAGTHPHGAPDDAGAETQSDLSVEYSLDIGAGDECDDVLHRPGDGGAHQRGGCCCLRTGGVEHMALRQHDECRLNGFLGAGGAFHRR